MFVLFKGVTVVGGGWYCDPEEALAAWEAHVGPNDLSTVLMYVS